MWPEPESDGRKRASFIEEARRAKIVEKAIETFAELGYANTSLARIAERAGISKGVLARRRRPPLPSPFYLATGRIAVPGFRSEAPASS